MSELPQATLPPDGAKQIVEDYLKRLRNQFYAGQDKKFYQQKSMLVTGITYLAGWLKVREAKLPARRYRQILNAIIETIQHHGKTADVGFFCRYFLTAVQSHVEHHGEEYYDEAKDFRNALDNIQGALRVEDPEKIAQAREETTDQLAEIAKMVKGGRPKGSGKKAAPPSRPKPDDQLSFF